MIIAIDGPAASGKSTTAKKVAEKLSCLHIDTGAMYRAVTLYFLKNKISLNHPTKVKIFLDRIKIILTDNGGIYLNGIEVTEEIRSEEINRRVSDVSAIFHVREKLVEIQRKIAQNGDIVMEGRDIGTRVFPDADLKFYLSADVKERAQRRLKEMIEKGEEKKLEDVISELSERDQIDSSRKYSPLKKANDAILIDTTDLTIEEQVSEIVANINQKIKPR